MSIDELPLFFFPMTPPPFSFSIRSSLALRYSLSHPCDHLIRLTLQVHAHSRGQFLAARIAILGHRAGFLAGTGADLCTPEALHFANRSGRVRAYWLSPHMRLYLGGVHGAPTPLHSESCPENASRQPARGRYSSKVSESNWRKHLSIRLTPAQLFISK